MPTDNNEIVCKDCGQVCHDRDEYLEHRKYPCKSLEAPKAPPIKKKDGRSNKHYDQFPNECTMLVNGKHCTYKGKDSHALAMHLRFTHQCTIKDMLNNEPPMTGQSVHPSLSQQVANQIVKDITSPPVSNVVIRFCPKCETIWDGFYVVKFCPDCGTELKSPKKRKTFKVGGD